MQVYIKRGKGLADPFITLRHAEWGHSQAFNMVLNSWAGDRPLISSSEQQQVPPTEQQHPAAAVGQQECINRRQKAFAGQMLRAEEAEPAAAEGPAVTKAKGEAANGAASNTTAKESDNNKRKGNKRKGSAKKHKQGVAKKHKQADNKQDKQADISLQNSLKALNIKRMPTTPEELKTVVQKQCCSLHFGCTKPGDRTDEEQKVCDEKLQVVRKANGHLRPLVGESRRR